MAYAWTLFSIVSDIKEKLWDEKGPDINGIILQLHYKVTSSILLACCSTITMMSWFGPSPTLCYTNDASGENDFNINQFCFLHPSKIYTTENLWSNEKLKHKLPGLNWKGTSSNDTSIQDCLSSGDVSVEECASHTVYYYQFTSFFLLFQAVCFYLPRFVWTRWENNTIDLLHKTLDTEESEKRKAITAAEFIIDRADRGVNSMYSMGYMMAEMVMVLNLLLQWFLTSSFLGTLHFRDEEINFYNLGTKTIFNERHFLPSMMMFPRLTSCTYRYYSSGGGKGELDALCLLPLNVIHDKIFLLLWFWFYILSVFTVYKAFYRICVYLSPELRKFILDREIGDSVLNKRECRNVVLSTLCGSHSDFLFVEIFNNNADSSLVQETLREMRRLKQTREGKHGKQGKGTGQEKQETIKEEMELEEKKIDF